MRRGSMLAAALFVVASVGAGCSDDDPEPSGAAVTTVPTIPSGAIAPSPSSGSAGAQACRRVTEQLVTAAIGSPYSEASPKVLDNFPSPGVTGFECQWQLLSTTGAQRMLRVDMLNFDRTPEGSLSKSWDGAVKIAGDLATEIDDVGEAAIGASLPGVASVSARQGSWQVTALSTSDGTIPPADIGALAFVVQAALTIAAA